MKFNEVIRSKNLVLVALVLMFIAGTAVGLLAGLSIRKSNSTNSNRIHLNLSYPYVNPLLECDSTVENIGSLRDLENTLEKYIDSEVRKSHVSTISIYLRDLNNGPWVGINEKEDFSPASLIKVPLLIAYLKQSEANPQILNQLMPIESIVAYQDQNILPDEQLGLGQQYSVLDLLKKMIIYSDNVAYDILVNKIDSSFLIAAYQDFGIDISKGLKDPAGNILSVKDYASFFRILFNASYLSDSNSNLALEILTQSTYKDGLLAGVPEDTVVAHKFGERRYAQTSELQLHDCGIVYLPDSPYLICVMTRGNDFKQLSTIIAEISRMVYSDLSQQRQLNDK